MAISGLRCFLFINFRIFFRTIHFSLLSVLTRTVLIDGAQDTSNHIKWTSVLNTENQQNKQIFKKTVHLMYTRAEWTIGNLMISTQCDTESFKALS